MRLGARAGRPIGEGVAMPSHFFISFERRHPGKRRRQRLRQSNVAPQSKKVDEPAAKKTFHSRLYSSPQEISLSITEFLDTSCPFNRTIRSATINSD
jgi:hypothetical protein